MQSRSSLPLLALLAGSAAASCTGSRSAKAAAVKTSIANITISSSITSPAQTDSSVIVQTNTAPTVDASTASSNTTSLNPIVNFNATDGYVPSKNITLNWGQNGTSMVQVDLSMNYSTVVLEQLTSVSAVDCDASSVLVTFGSEEEFDLVQTYWSSLNESFVLVTNHMGDCDAEFERGFFLADVETLSFAAADLTVQTVVEKTDVASTGDEIIITFSNMPAVSTKRAIALDETGLTIESDISLLSAQKLFNYENHVTITADRAEISSSVLYSGVLRYSISAVELTDFTFDVSNNIFQDLALTFDFTAPYTYKFAYDISPLSYSIVNIPGIVTLGPTLTLGIGADFAVEAALNITTEFSSQIEAGNLHIDFLKPALSTATNWVPTYAASANITAEAGVTLTPFVSATVELQAEILSGLLDLSTGATIKPSFPIEFDFSAATGVDSTTGAVTTPSSSSSSSDTCPNGFGVSVNFDLDIILFATEWASVTYDVYNAELGSYCYNWF